MRGEPTSVRFLASMLLSQRAWLPRIRKIVWMRDDRAHDISQGRTANKVEGVAGYKGESRLGPWRQNRNIFWRNDNNLVDDITRIPHFGVQIDRVARMNILEPSEESIAVSGDTNVTGFTRNGSAVDVSDGAI